MESTRLCDALSKLPHPDASAPAATAAIVASARRDAREGEADMDGKQAI
jgi:hypothetical protein